MLAVHLLPALLLLRLLLLPRPLPLRLLLLPGSHRACLLARAAHAHQRLCSRALIHPVQRRLLFPARELRLLPPRSLLLCCLRQLCPQQLPVLF